MPAFPPCFGLEWDPDADRCMACPVDAACIDHIIDVAAPALTPGRVPTAEEIRRGIGLGEIAADVVHHQLQRRRVGDTRPPTGPQQEPTSVYERWQLERETRPLIARLQPGDEIRREYNGEIHLVRCEYGYWLYRGRRLPTLASVVVAIAGAREYPKQRRADGRRPSGTRDGAICSATRFFRLDRIAAFRSRKQKQ